MGIALISSILCSHQLLPFAEDADYNNPDENAAYGDTELCGEYSQDLDSQSHPCMQLLHEDELPCLNMKEIIWTHDLSEVQKSQAN